jgi:SAM-dependent methyltransferase
MNASRQEEDSPLLVPPEPLRVRVHGDADLAGFEMVARGIAGILRAAIPPDVDFGPCCRVLDFGCGCGRVLRYVQPFCGGAAFSGTDIDEEAIAWCQRALGHLGTFSANAAWPPLGFADATFDLIYAVSVFTHLPEDMQDAWLAELQRVARPGAYILLTTHGPDLIPAAHRADLDRAGFVYLAGSGTTGLPAFYQTAFHTGDYVRARWGTVFEIVRIIPRGIMNHQDLIVCRREGHEAARSSAVASAHR